VDEPAFGLVVTQTGDEALWAPHRDHSGSVVAVAGRVVFDDADWDEATTLQGSGGLAARIVYARYRECGATALDRLNGNFAVVVYDAAGRRVHLVTDYCGVFPAFEVDTPEGRIYGSHPDALAEAANERHRLDEVSLAEFALARTVTPPYSYYERIRAADHGTIFTFELDAPRTEEPSKRRYFEFTYRGDPGVPESDLADALAAALHRAVARRTLVGLGPAAVALSGGLDSRVILANVASREQAFAFSCYDEPNRELRTAEAIARALSARFLPLQRGFDFYADSAEQGVRISGGMGSLANNHFLGVIPRLTQDGMQVLLTGCYCDYLFKGLPLNRRVDWLTRRETLAPFRHEFYFSQSSSASVLAGQARERWESRIPSELRKLDAVETVFQVEARRTFPLCYEGDNQQRVVPQRVTGWCPPFVDREVIDVYCRLPYHFKLNRSVFKKVVAALTPELRSIPDANTGASPGASSTWEWIRGGQLRVQRKWQDLSGAVASQESWPNWERYVTRSRKLQELWTRPNADARDFFRKVLGVSAVPDRADALTRHQVFEFVGLLTLKLWLDQLSQRRD
jgi:asparagine synthetase B (glutamine-hydrolysing)